MIYSNERKLCLSGWLKEHSQREYNSPLKLQKYLLFYEAFSKVAGETPDFSHLRGYKRGPVFSNVWGDYTKERGDFNRAADKEYREKRNMLDEERAEKSAFIVRILSESELSELTHKLNLWKAKEHRIMQGEYQVTLEEQDFNDDDRKLISLLGEMYPIDLVRSSEVFSIDSKYFVFKKSDVPRLSIQHFDTLGALAAKEDLFNPVFVEIDDQGGLLVD